MLTQKVLTNHQRYDIIKEKGCVYFMSWETWYECLKCGNVLCVSHITIPTVDGPVLKIGVNPCKHCIERAKLGEFEA